MILTFDKGHINPAVTWACLITNKISVLRALSYMVAQLIGGILGSALLKSILPNKVQYSMGCHGLNPLLTPGQGFGAEVIFTAIFIFVVFATGNFIILELSCNQILSNQPFCW
jgi:aquaporin PIP